MSGVQVEQYCLFFPVWFLLLCIILHSWILYKLEVIESELYNLIAFATVVNEPNMIIPSTRLRVHKLHPPAYV